MAGRLINYEIIVVEMMEMNGAVEGFFFPWRIIRKGRKIPRIEMFFNISSDLIKIFALRNFIRTEILLCLIILIFFNTLVPLLIRYSAVSMFLKFLEFQYSVSLPATDTDNSTVSINYRLFLSKLSPLPLVIVNYSVPIE